MQGRASQHGNELFAPKARYQIARATQAPFQSARDGFQARIAGGMAIAVVVGFEVIDIDHHQRHFAIILLGLFPELGEVLVKVTAVGHFREHVAARSVVQLLVGCLQVFEQQALTQVQ